MNLIFSLFVCVSVWYGGDPLKKAYGLCKKKSEFNSHLHTSRYFAEKGPTIR